MRSLSFFGIAVALFGALEVPANLHMGARLEMKQNQLFIDGEKQPQLFGAELQYYRQRGGNGKNVPRAQVVEQWQRAIDRMIEAKMNTVSFSIPSEFHEFADGKFDFTGSVDADGDGKPDYPSRDLITFFKMLDSASLKRILVRPGPHRNPKLWFEALLRQVLDERMGPDQPIVWVQITSLPQIRRIWESLGVKEPDVMFTLGPLPNNVLRGKQSETGLLTVNLSPHNSPFKADLDVMSAETANVDYFGQHQEWTMGPEIQGGWLKGSPASPAARQQTYLTVLGHGLKAMFVSDFDEDYDWKRLGKLVIAPYQDFLGRATAVYDRVALVTDGSSFREALLGFVMNADVKPRIFHGESSDPADLDAADTLLHIDTGTQYPRTAQLLKNAMLDGKNVVNFFGFKTAVGTAAVPAPTLISEEQASRRPLTYYRGDDGRLVGAKKGGSVGQFRSQGELFSYDLTGAKNCEGILFSGENVVGYRCRLAGGNHFVQIGSRFFDRHAGPAYAIYDDHLSEKTFLKALFRELNVKPSLRWSPNAERTVAFARKDPAKKLLWITVKTASRKDQNLKLTVRADLLQENLAPIGKEPTYRVKDLLTNSTFTMTQKVLSGQGFDVPLKKEGSTVFVIEHLP